MTSPHRAASKSRKQMRCFHARAMPTRVAYICGRVCACTRMCVCVCRRSPAHCLAGPSPPTPGERPPSRWVRPRPPPALSVRGDRLSGSAACGAVCTRAHACLHTRNQPPHASFTAPLCVTRYEGKMSRRAADMTPASTRGTRHVPEGSVKPRLTPRGPRLAPSPAPAQAARGLSL